MFDGPYHNDSVFILFTRYNNDACDPWPWKAIGVVFLSQVVCEPSLTVLAEMAQSVSFGIEPQTDAQSIPSMIDFVGSIKISISDTYSDT